MNVERASLRKVSKWTRTLPKGKVSIRMFALLNLNKVINVIQLLVFSSMTSVIEFYDLS